MGPRFVRDVMAWIEERRYLHAGPGYDLMSPAHRAWIRPLVNAAGGRVVVPDDAADMEFREAIGLDPDHAVAHVNLGMVLRDIWLRYAPAEADALAKPNSGRRSASTPPTRPRITSSAGSCAIPGGTRKLRLPPRSRSASTPTPRT